MMWFWQLKNVLIIAPAHHVAPSPGTKMIKSSSQQAHCWLLMTHVFWCVTFLCVFLQITWRRSPRKGRRLKMSWTSSDILTSTRDSPLIGNLYEWNSSRTNTSTRSMKVRRFLLHLQMFANSPCKVVILPWIFPGAPLICNGAPGNIQGNLDRFVGDVVFCWHVGKWAMMF